MLSRKIKKLGRNDVCPCGSGSKYKRCCLSSEHTLSEIKKPITTELIQKSQIRLKNRAQENLGKQCIMHEGELTVKMSEVILDLADDLLKIAETKSQYKKAIDITCTAWNLSILNGVGKEGFLDKFFNKMDEQTKDDVFNIISSIIEKKDCHYSHINRLIIDYEVLGNKNNIHLNVISTVPEDEVAELSP